ncbi:phosphoribosyltransferase family protein [Plantactinospora sp. GCM10030261]|uniref:phosphoribosyltransferase family protein n=1 Tax=Plantactinospora sp. GCM10030261 TaxID=3273420 RepID=UPI003613C8F2
MPVDLRKRLLDGFRWIDPGPSTPHLVSDVSGWWRDAEVLAAIGPALAAPHRSARPTAVLAPEVAGLPPGALTAVALGVGLVAAHKRDPNRPIAGPTSWVDTTTDHRGRRVGLGVRDRQLGPGDRVLVVDDWVDSGAQLRALYALVARRGAESVGAATVVAGCAPAVAHELRLTCLLTADELPER